MTPLIRPATQDDLAAFPHMKNAVSIRALVAELDGKPVGIGGLIYRRNGNVEAFSEMKDEMRAFPKTIVKAARQLTVLFADTGAVALANPKEKHSRKLLEHLGFEPLDERVGTYRWRG